MSEHDEKSEMIKNDTSQGDAKSGTNITKVIKTRELSGPPLNWAVAKAEGKEAEVVRTYLPFPTGIAVLVNEWYWSPSTEWSQCGPLITRFEVEAELYPARRGGWACAIIPGPHAVGQADANLTPPGTSTGFGDSPQVALCRAVVEATLGDTVEIPAELLEVPNG